MATISNVSSPVIYVDLYGKRRQLAKIQVIEREIRLLQDEIKSLADLELASTCCKQLGHFLEVTPDPLVAMNQHRGKSRNLWKNLWRKIGSMICCCCCCNAEVCCSCCTCANGCCWGGQQKACSSGCCKCPKISCHCSCKCNSSCSKCSVCCCCNNPCLCF